MCIPWVWFWRMVNLTKSKPVFDIEIAQAATIRIASTLRAVFAESWHFTCPFLRPLENLAR